MKSHTRDEWLKPWLGYHTAKIGSEKLASLGGEANALNRAFNQPQWPRMAHGS